MLEDKASIESAPKTLHGFERTRCDCEMCRVPCRHVPGGLDPSDLERLCPEGQDVFIWAEQHLRALTNQAYPLLVPARQANGHCHWLFQGLCAVHENAPYGCAYFDSHQSREEADQRRKATNRARSESAHHEELYYRTWLHLCRRGLIGIPGDRSAMIDEARNLARKVKRRWALL